MINSEMFNGMNNKEAIEKIIDYLEEKRHRQEGNKLQAQRLAHFQTEILGNADPDDLLRRLRLGS